jgi:hypothetical protein
VGNNGGRGGGAAHHQASPALFSGYHTPGMSNSMNRPARGYQHHASNFNSPATGARPGSFPTPQSPLQTPVDRRFSFKSKTPSGVSQTPTSSTSGLRTPSANAMTPRFSNDAHAVTPRFSNVGAQNTARFRGPIPHSVAGNSNAGVRNINMGSTPNLTGPTSVGAADASSAMGTPRLNSFANNNSGNTNSGVRDGASSGNDLGGSGATSVYYQNQSRFTANSVSHPPRLTPAGSGTLPPPNSHNLSHHNQVASTKIQPPVTNSSLDPQGSKNANVSSSSVKNTVTVTGNPFAAVMNSGASQNPVQPSPSSQQSRWSFKHKPSTTPSQISSNALQFQVPASPAQSQTSTVGRGGNGDGAVSATETPGVRRVQSHCANQQKAEQPGNMWDDGKCSFNLQ